MIPVDLTSLLRQRLAESRRPPDGLLHPSGDLLGSLRHAQLRLAGAPTIESQLVSDIRLMTGTMWHRFFGEMLLGQDVTLEVSVTKGLPEGWSGTADAVFWAAEARGNVLVDFKSIKGEGMKWVLKDGAKEEHLWQLSAYWHALYEMQKPMVNGFAVWYIPMNDTTERDEMIEPVIMECDPLPRDLVFGVMEDRWQACQEYLGAMPPDLPFSRGMSNPDLFLNDKLVPEMERVQKLYWNGKQHVFDVKLMPHWSAQFCPYQTELCSCSEQGTNKIGHYALEDGEWNYVPRSGEEYEDIRPVVEPSAAEKRKRAKEADANSESEGSGADGGAAEGPEGDAGASEERDQPALR